MPVNETTIKITNGWSGPNELELKPIMVSSGTGFHKNARLIVVTIRCKRDDANDDHDVVLTLDVPIDELRNAIELIERSHFDEEKDPNECVSCGRP
jgi:hypothetical protein